MRIVATASARAPCAKKNREEGGGEEEEKENSISSLLKPKLETETSTFFSTRIAVAR